MLARQRERFSEVFYVRHRCHVMQAVKTSGILLTISGTCAGASLVFILGGGGNVLVASVASAIFLCLAWAACYGIRDELRVRVLPYFERRLGGTDTWLAGENLLWHSRRLDEAATRLGIRPLSAFASGDDLIHGEELHWFPAEEALRTAERLLQPDVSNGFSPAVISDLTRLRDALRLACSQSVRFCLLLREGSSTSGQEMNLRKGGFF